jgi:signal transduction histidine kinase
LRRIPIRMKLAAALAVPLVALALITSLEVVRTSTAVDSIRQQTDLARSAIGPAGLITTLQNERTWTLVELVGFDAMVQVQEEGYDETRTHTDEALAAFRDEVSTRGGRVADAYEPALEGLESEIQQIRADVDAFTAPRALDNVDFTRAIFDRYTVLVDPLFDATTRISYEVNDAELRQGTKLADSVARQIETMSQMLILTLANAWLSPGGVDLPSEISEIAMLHSDFERQGQEMRTATGPYRAIAEEHFPTEIQESTSLSVQEALDTARISDANAVMASLNVPREAGYLGYQDQVHAEIVRRADHLNSTAESRRLWFTVLAVVAFAAAALLTWLVSRSITRPLRSLTRQATDMAEHRLPEAVLDILETPLGENVNVPHVDPVSVRTRDEVSDVAAALNTVQDSALELAVEQAVLRRNIADSFVNLGRRNQNLLGRQLDFITELESNETDPDTLASLFRLDHLATRMRRNAESLLVLAGIEPPRKWAAPVRLTDVVRAALGEVENYQRVTIRNTEPATVVGSVAADLAHLVAELIENALTFSPPDRAVEVTGSIRPDGSYSLAVIDSGFGMAAEDIARANRRLAGAESFTIAPSKYLGHYVAGNLAARHGIRIQLHESPAHGITAAVNLPPDLITNEASRGALVITDPRGTAAVPSPPAGNGVGGPGPWPADVPAAAGPAQWPGNGAGSGPGVVDMPPAAPLAPAPVAPAPAEAGPGSWPGNGAGGGPAGPLPELPAAAVGSGEVDQRWQAEPAAGPQQPPAHAGPGGAYGAGTGPQQPGRTERRSAEQTRTASGLVKRARRGDSGPGRRPAKVPSGELLTALQSHTGHVQSVSPASAPPPAPEPAHQAPASPAAGAGPTGTTASGLVRRVRGAQLPVAQPVSLRRGDPSGGPQRPVAPAQAAPAPAGPPPSGAPAGALPSGPPAGGFGPGPMGGGPGPVGGGPGPMGGPGPVGGGSGASGGNDDGAARDVYGFLSSFSSGVQRGLDESRKDRGR